MSCTLSNDTGLTETEAWPLDLLNPLAMLDRAVYNETTNATVLGALYLAAGWVAGHLEQGTDPAEVRRLAAALRDRLEQLMDARWTEATS